MKIATGEIEDNILRQIRTLPTKASPVLHLKSIRKYLLIPRGGGKSSQDITPRLDLARHPALREGDAGPFSHPWHLGPPTPATAPCPVCSCFKLQAIGNSLNMSIHMPAYSVIRVCLRSESRSFVTILGEVSVKQPQCLSPPPPQGGLMGEFCGCSE